MTKGKVYFVVDFAIHEGKFDQFESIAQAMITGTLKEAGTLGYDWFLSADRKRCRLLETYADVTAVLAHMTGPVVHELVPKILGTSSISGFEVYGDPGPEAAKMLAGAGAEIFPLWHALGR
jgi:quinol monooxygenase YgiN